MKLFINCTLDGKRNTVVVSFYLSPFEMNILNVFSSIKSKLLKASFKSINILYLVGINCHA